MLGKATLTMVTSSWTRAKPKLAARTVHQTFAVFMRPGSFSFWLRSCRKTGSHFSGSCSFPEHDLAGKPVPTFPDHALEPDAEGFRKGPPASRRNGHRATFRSTRDPSELEASVEKRGAEEASDMWPPFAPIETGAAERALPFLRGGERNAELGKKVPALWRYFARFFSEHEEAAILKLIGKRNGAPPAEMIVAGPCLAQLLWDSRATRRTISGEHHQSLDGLCDLRRC